MSITIGNAIMNSCRGSAPSETFRGSNTGKGNTKRECNRGRVEARFSLDSVKYTLLSMPSARCAIHLCGKWNYKRIPMLRDPRLRLTPCVHNERAYVGLTVVCI